jgi:hypothetical protein
MFFFVIIPTTCIPSFIIGLHPNGSFVPAVVVEKQEEIPSTTTNRICTPHPVADHLEPSPA